MQFGTKLPGRIYVPRPTALGILLNERGELLAANAPRGLVLPGGGIDPGETAEQGLVREFIEETGYEVEPLEELGGAVQFEANEREAYEKHCRFFRVRLIRKVGPPLEDDHTPVWVGRAYAEANLRERASAWALKTLMP